MTDYISPGHFHATEGLADWRVLGDGACAFFRTSSFAASARLVEAIGELAGVDEHPPAVDIRSAGVTVRLLTLTEEYAGLTRHDVDVAQAISRLARELGAIAEPSTVRSLLAVVGAPRIAEVMPFWRAVLGYEPRIDSPDEDLVDPAERLPGLWFEPMDATRADGGGAIHLAVWVPPEEAEARVAAALAAGGRLVRDDYAPSWWTLADAAGNEADVATVVGRD